MCALDAGDVNYEGDESYFNGPSEDTDGDIDTTELAAFNTAGSRSTAAAAAPRPHERGNRPGSSRDDWRRDGRNHSDRQEVGRPTDRHYGNHTSDPRLDGRQPRRFDSRRDRKPSPDTAPSGASPNASRKREAPGEGSGATADRAANRRFRSGLEGISATAARIRRTPQLAEDAPSLSADDNVIQDYIKNKRVCFNHARGVTCKRMVNKGFCSFSHASDIIPFGAYPRTQTALAALGDDDENALYDASDILTALTLAGRAESTSTATAGLPEADA